MTEFRGRQPCDTLRQCRLPGAYQAYHPSFKHLKSVSVQKGHFAVYVGETKKKRYVISDLVFRTSFVSKFAKSGGRRVRVSSSSGWSPNPMQRGNLH
ncbi:unnamed protein product [Thlaspi arvense]|uniref:Uncharacterized protein n=1 Tax=Thlaspi arvense TaxID=13288 RepID=A0AAU9RYR8_THLAR|nr:unnamed protein product [Thlaspi arvense]